MTESQISRFEKMKFLDTGLRIEGRRINECKEKVISKFMAAPEMGASATCEHEGRTVSEDGNNCWITSKNYVRTVTCFTRECLDALN